jgi:hypothetical protein
VWMTECQLKDCRCNGTREGDDDGQVSSRRNLEVQRNFRWGSYSPAMQRPGTNCFRTLILNGQCASLYVRGSSTKIRIKYSHFQHFAVSRQARDPLRSASFLEDALLMESKGCGRLSLAQGHFSSSSSILGFAEAPNFELKCA